MTRRLAATKAAELLKDSIHDEESPSRLDAGGMEDDEENDSENEGDENDDEETLNRGASLAGAASGTAPAFVKKEKTKWTTEEVCFSLHCAYVDALISLFLTTPPLCTHAHSNSLYRTTFYEWLFAHTMPKIGK